MDDTAKKCSGWILKIHKRSKAVPKTVLQYGVTLLSSEPLTGGGFADIYTGTLYNPLTSQHETVALKVSHFFPTMSPAQLDRMKEVGIPTTQCYKVMELHHFPAFLS